MYKSTLFRYDFNRIAEKWFILRAKKKEYSWIVIEVVEETLIPINCLSSRTA